MQVYRSWKGLKCFFVLLCSALIAWLIWAVVSSLNKGEVETGFIAALGVLIFLLCLISVLRYKIILGDDFIERVGLCRRRVLLKDVIRIEVDSFQAFVVTDKFRLHIGQEVRGREQIIKLLFQRLDLFQKTEVAGNPLIISYLLAQESKYNLEQTSARAGERFCRIVAAKLIERRWLYREIEVSTTQGTRSVIYFGRGLGYECVLVNGRVVSKKGRVLWYVPEFDFQIEGVQARIKVRVWPWLTIRSFSLEVAGAMLYSEN